MAFKETEAIKMSLRGAEGDVAPPMAGLRFARNDTGTYEQL
jgi:hypothetical protein